MTELFGMHGRLTARPSEGDALAAILLEAAELLRNDGSCLLYVVSRSREPDQIWVTEAWTTREAHAASLEDERVRALIGRAMPLLAGPPEATELRPLGGKGLESRTDG